MQQKTIFLIFYKTKDYFFDLIKKQKASAHNISVLEKLQKHAPRSVLQKGQTPV